MELMAVVLKSPTSTQRFESAKTLLNYGFAAYGLTDIRPDAPFSPVPVVLGESESVMPRLDGNTTLLAEKAKLSDLSVRVEVEPQLTAPVAEGQQIGTLTVTGGGEVLLTVPLTAGRAVARLSYWQIFLRCLRTAFLSPC